MNILIVEDEPSIANNITTILQLYKHTCVHQPNGQAAIDYLTQTNLLPQIIISDVMMPEVDGFELLEYVKNNNSTKDIPFCLLSARADVVDIDFAFSKGADAYLTKPFTAKDLLKTVEKCINII